jgi:hypothetical protein
MTQITTPSKNKQTFLVQKLGHVHSLRTLSKSAIINSFNGRPNHEEIGNFLREQFTPPPGMSRLTSHIKYIEINAYEKSIPFDDDPKYYLHVNIVPRYFYYM